MPKTVNPDPNWTDTLEVPLPHETMDSGDVAVPDTRLLANDKWLKKEFGARLDALERAVWPTTIRAELTASETDPANHIWRFEYSLSTNRGTIASATLDFGDGSPVVTLSNPAQPGFVTHDYPDAGATYTAVLSVQTSETAAAARVAQVVVMGSAAGPAPTDPNPTAPTTVEASNLTLYNLAGQTSSSTGDNSGIYTPEPGYRLRELHTGYAGTNYYSYAPHTWTSAAQPLPGAIYCEYEIYREDDRPTEYSWDTAALGATLTPSTGSGTATVTVRLQASGQTGELYLEYGGNGNGFAGGEMQWTDSQVLKQAVAADTVQFTVDRAALARGNNMLFLSTNRDRAAALTVTAVSMTT